MKVSNKNLCPKERVIYLYSSKSGYRVMAAGKIGIKVFASQYTLPVTMFSNRRAGKTSIAIYIVRAKEAVRNSMWLLDKYGVELTDETNQLDLEKTVKDFREPPLDAYPTVGVISDKVFE